MTDLSTIDPVASSGISSVLARIASIQARISTAPVADGVRIGPRCRQRR